MICHPLTDGQRQITHGKPSIVYGYYVYEWRDGITPFYIGCVKGRRAWKPHLPHVEEIKESCSNFKVAIVRQYLSKDQAHQQERFYIAVAQRRGIKLVNKKVPC